MAEFTGRKMLAVTLSFFGVIIAVNGVMAYQAVTTFSGLEVKNGYIASQTWDAEMAAQRALGWTLAASYDRSQEQMELVFTDRDGRPAQVDQLFVLVGRPTSTQNDSNPAFVHEGSAYRAPLALGPGKWMLKIEAVAPDGTLFRQRQDLFVKG
jgi:nitrogen fixation protein FixH